MARLPEQFVQQVLQVTDLVDLVGRYVALKKRGRDFVGLCPFHDDKKPSMYVSPTKQIFKCFACGAGGNAIGFVMSYEKLTFREAVRMLAEQANLVMPAEADSTPVAPGMSKNDLAAVTEFTSRFFVNQLKSPAGAAALQYAKDRGLSDETIKKFAIGYAPDSWDSLITAAKRQGFTEQQLIAAGVMRQRENSPGGYDWFRNRLMFPIHDITGRVIGFGGRALADDEKAKYINSPEGILFDKSSLVFGLSFARDEMVKRKQAVVVEGYMDVIAPHQEGVTNVVATLGTALTERHVKLLGRYAEEVVLIFDADVAGAAAAERALELFLQQQMHVRVATIPAGKDPCDFSLAQGGEAFQKVIDEAPDALQYVWDLRYDAYQAAADNPTQRQRVIEDFLQLVANSVAYGAIDALRQQNIAQHIAHLLNISAIDVSRQIKRLARPNRPRGQQSRPVDPQLQMQNTSMPANTSPERVMLEVLLDKPELFDTIVERIDPPHMSDPLCKAIAEKIWSLGLDGLFTFEALLANEEMAAWGGMLSELAFAGARRGNHEQTLNEVVQIILDRYEHREVQMMRQQIHTNDDALHNLRDKLKNSNNKLRRPKIR